MESSDISDAEKNELQCRKDSLDLQQLIDKTQNFTKQAYFNGTEGGLHSYG